MEQRHYANTCLWPILRCGCGRPLGSGRVGHFVSSTSPVFRFRELQSKIEVSFANDLSCVVIQILIVVMKDLYV